MQDQRRRGRNGDQLDQAVGAALIQHVAGMTPELAAQELSRLREALGHLLTTAPSAEDGCIDDLRSRARIAAAFRVRLPEAE